MDLNNEKDVRRFKDTLMIMMVIGLLLIIIVLIIKYNGLVGMYQTLTANCGNPMIIYDIR